MDMDRHLCGILEHFDKEFLKRIFNNANRKRKMTIYKYNKM